MCSSTSVIKRKPWACCRCCEMSVSSWVCVRLCEFFCDIVRTMLFHDLLLALASRVLKGIARYLKIATEQESWNVQLLSFAKSLYLQFIRLQSTWELLTSLGTWNVHGVNNNKGDFSNRNNDALLSRQYVITPAQVHLSKQRCLPKR